MRIKKKKAISTNPQIIANNIYTKLDEIPEMINVNEVLIENQPSLKNPAMKTIASFLFGYFISRGIIDKPNNKISNVKFISPSNKLKVNNTYIHRILTKIDSTDKIYQLICKMTKKYLNIDKDDDLSIIVDKNNEMKYIRLVLRYLMNKKNIITNLSIHMNKDIKLDEGQLIELLKKLEKDGYNYQITKRLAIKYTESLIETDPNNNEWLNHMKQYKKQDDICDAFLQGYYYMFMR
jgi:hypothetical protein